MNSPGGMNVGGVYYDVELNTGQLLQDSRKADSALRGVEFRMGAVALAVKALAAALALIKMAQVADDMRLLSARVEVAAGSIERGAEAMNALARISVRTQTALADSVQVFTRLNSSIMQMGGTQQDTLRITELLAMAIKVSGASATEAASAMTQFGQALGSGQLQGDELRSLLENAPYLMKQLADGIGVPVGALKKLGEEGKLTADVVTAALTKAAGQIETDFSRLPRTFEAAMMALVDQLRAASQAADDLSGTSSVLTGVATGTAEAVGMLADQLRATSGEANSLGRNDAIGEWSRRTTLVLSYVADAADMAWQTLSVFGRNVRFVFEGVGREIGGIGAQIAAVMRGDFAQARALGDQIKADAAAARAELDAADARSLGRRQLSGQAMRERMGAMANTAGGYMDRSDRLAAGGQPSTLKAPPAPPPKAKKAGGEKDAGDDALDQIKQQIAAEAKLAQIESDRIRIADERAAKEAEAEERARRQREQNLSGARDIIAGEDPVARITREAELRSEALLNAAMIDLDNAKTYSDAMVAVEREKARRIADIDQQRVDQQASNNVQSLNLIGDLAAQSFSILQRAGKEQSGLAKALFVAERAIAVASIIMNTEVAAAKAGAQLGIFGLPLAATIRATGYASAGLVAGQALGQAFGGGRQFGGPVSAGSMYRVNETGAPEMFVGSGGKQYLMPTTGGQVIPADEVGGSGGWTINVYGAPEGTTARVNEQQRTVDIAVGRAKAEIAGEFRENSGQVWGALTSSSNVRGRF